MFARRLHITHIYPTGSHHPCPIAWLDSFSMRSFTNHAAFDDTLPIADGLLEAGHRVPLDLLHEHMQLWFHRKQYLQQEDRLHIEEAP